MSSGIIRSSSFSEEEVWDAVQSALENEQKLAQVKRSHFQNICQRFEQEQNLPSDLFLRRFEAGELGDDQQFFDWYAAKRGFDLWSKRLKILFQITDMQPTEQ